MSTKKSKVCDEEIISNTIDVPTNEIWVHSFDAQSALRFRMQLKHKYAENPDSPIVIYINSPGGSAAALLSMMESMDECPAQKITVAYGEAMSAGAILLAYGDIRMCGRHSRIMIHQVLSGTVGNIEDMNNTLEEINRLNEYIMDILAKKCKLKDYEELQSIFKENLGRDIFMDAQEALEFGIIDHIGTPLLIPNQTIQVGVVAGSRFEMQKKQQIEMQEAMNEAVNAKANKDKCNSEECGCKTKVKKEIKKNKSKK